MDVTMEDLPKFPFLCDNRKTDMEVGIGYIGPD